MYTTITGYTYGTEEVAKSPLSMEHLSLLKQTVLFTEEDEKYLHLAGEVLQD
ncbi:protogloblin ApPgb, partial [Nostoc flagelliforme FACHB-838]|nr:protogloblin ApPgb [Nostoc flagelliforme FACHB-838]MBD2537037.1 protogloblin ApPgb [Nostoc flagelliforme FACHB-838]